MLLCSTPLGMDEAEYPGKGPQWSRAVGLLVGRREREGGRTYSDLFLQIGPTPTLVNQL